MKLRLILSSLLALSMPIAAHADTIFSTSGTFQSGGTFSGTFTLDTTTDLITAFNINLSADGFDVTVTERFNFGDPGFASGNFQNNGGSFYLIISTGTTNPYLCTAATACNNGSGTNQTGINYNDGGGSDRVVSGTPAAIAPTPEPSSLCLLATGSLGMMAFLRRRTRQSQHLPH